MIKISVRDINENSNTILCCAFLCHSQLQITFSNAIMKIVGYTRGLDKILFNGILVVLVFLSLKKIGEAIKKEHLIFTYFFFISIVLSAISPLFNWEMAKTVYSETILKCFPAFYIANSIENMEKLKKYLGITSYIFNVSLFVNIFVFHAQELASGTYSQYLAYQFLIPAVISAVFFMNKFHLLHFINFCFAEIMVLSCGARGALFCSILILVFYIIFRKRNNIKNKVFSIGTIMVLGILIIKNMMNIVTWLLNLFYKWNVSVRVLDKIASSSFFEDNARVSLVKYSFDILAEHYFFGVGCLNDRVLLKNRISIGDQAIGWYPHNFFVELILQFGIVLGVILILLFLYSLREILFDHNDEDMIFIAYIFCGIGLFPLFFSGSYIASTEFFMLLGFCFHCFCRKKEGKNEYYT